MSGRLEGKVCVITGTGGSMGRATAVAFAREGASVVGCDVTVEPGQATVETVRDGGGKMVSMQPSRLNEPAEWDRARRNDVDLVFYLTREAWPHLKASGGVIVNMASLNASLSFKILPSLAHTTNKAESSG